MNGTFLNVVSFFVDMTFDLELERVIAEIKKDNIRTVCVQLPDGLKPQAGFIADEIQQHTCASVVIWAGSCYGACDLPLEVERLGVELLIQWGHAKWI